MTAGVDVHRVPDDRRAWKPIGSEERGCDDGHKCHRRGIEYDVAGERIEDLRAVVQEDVDVEVTDGHSSSYLVRCDAGVDVDPYFVCSGGGGRCDFDVRRLSKSERRRK